MRGAVLYGPRDVRFEEREVPKIINPTDAVIRISSACVCGSDLWPYRGIQPIAQPTPMGHEYCGIVEEVGSAVQSVKRGQFVTPTTATVEPGFTFAASAANQPVPMTSESVNKLGIKSSEGRSAVATKVPSASGTRRKGACAPPTSSRFWQDDW